jgi:hypothetical protein
LYCKKHNNNNNNDDNKTQATWNESTCAEKSSMYFCSNSHYSWGPRPKGKRLASKHMVREKPPSPHPLSTLSQKSCKLESEALDLTVTPLPNPQVLLRHCTLGRSPRSPTLL